MDPIQPKLYLDPLLPLSVRRDPGSLPQVAQGAVRGLLVCTGGVQTIRQDGQTLALNAPAMFRVNFAGNPAISRGRTTSQGWLLVIGGRLLDQLIVGTFGDPGFSRFLHEMDTPGRLVCESFGDEVSDGFHELESELTARRPAYRVRARLLLTNVLLLLYRSTLVTPELTNGDGMRLASVLDHIEQHYAEELSLQNLADIMGASPSYFSRLFRHEVGIPLFEHINRTRIRKACLLLRQPELPVTRIAFDVGYNSVSFFNRYFRRIMNVSPREYRRYLTS